MDEATKFLIAAVAFLLFAASPLFVGVSTYNSEWENPLYPTPAEAALDYLEGISEEITHPGVAQIIWVIGWALFWIYVGLNRGKEIYGRTEKQILVEE